ncbi:MAG: V-type ATP synthase subunit I [Candidatus Freyarchaeota archaeon]
MKFNPAKMGIIKIICHKDYERDLIRCLHEVGEVEIIDVLEKGTSAPTELSEQEQSIYKLLNDVQRQVDYLGLAQYIPILATKIPDKKRWVVYDKKIETIIDFCENTLSKVEPKVEDLSQEQIQKRQELDQQKTILKVVETLEPLEISVSQLGPGRYVYAVAGTVPTIKSGTLKWRIKEVTEGNYVYRSVSVGDGRDVVFIAILNQYRGVVDRVLTAFGFEEFKIPPDLKGTTPEIKSKTSSNIQKLEEALQKLEDRRMELIREWGYQLLICKELLEIERDRIDAKKYFRITKTTVEIWGWVPLDQVKRLSAAIDNATQRSAIIEVTKTIPSGEVPPTKMQNAQIFGAYQKLVRGFGIPNYKEIDPSKLMILTFPLFFGLMFPDIAHGAILALFALTILAWKLRKPVVTGIAAYIYEGAGLLFICGLSAIFFGFLFGAVFGSHAVYDPLWFNPFTTEGNFRLLRLSIVIGVMEITFGFCVKFVNLIKKGQKKLAVFQPLFLIWFYIGAFLIIYSDEYSVNFMNWFSPQGESFAKLQEFAISYLSSGKFTLENLQLFSQAITPWYYTTIRPLKCLEPLGIGTYLLDTHLWHLLELQIELTHNAALEEMTHLIQTMVILNTTAWGPAIHLPPVQFLTYGCVFIPLFISLFGTIAVSHDKTSEFSEQLDYLISCLSHTISFARIFALAAVHAILSEIFLELPGPPALANIIEVTQFGTYSVPTLVTESLLWAGAGAIVIVGLEGLLSFMNSLRLHWVEFFTKFYAGDGREFAPFASNRQLTRPEKTFEVPVLEKEIVVRSSGSKGKIKRRSKS